VSKVKHFATPLVHHWIRTRQCPGRIRKRKARRSHCRTTKSQPQDRVSVRDGLRPLVRFRCRHMSSLHQGRLLDAASHSERCCRQARGVAQLPLVAASLVNLLTRDSTSPLTDCVRQYPHTTLESVPPPTVYPSNVGCALLRSPLVWSRDARCTSSIAGIFLLPTSSQRTSTASAMPVQRQPTRESPAI